MKKMTLVLMLVFLSVGFAGCIKIENRCYVYPDGAGKITTVSNIDIAKIISTAGPMVGSLEIEKLGISGLSDLDFTFSIYTDDIKKFKDPQNPISKGIKEFVWAKEKDQYHFKAVFDLKTARESSPQGKVNLGKGPEAEMMKNMLFSQIDLALVVVMPGKVVKSNGVIEGRKVIWNTTLQKMFEQDELTLEAFSESSCPELDKEYKTFKEESSKASQKYQEMVNSRQEKNSEK